MPTPGARSVRRCCYVAMFVQAVVINLTPLFFIPLQREYGFSFEQLGRLVLVNFATQMIVDLLCTAVVDRFGLLRPLTLAAQLLAVAGLWLFAGAGWIFPQDPYTGLLLGTVVFSTGCGLVEVLVSPIIQAVPSAHKESQMAVLHAFYPIGKVVVVLFTALILWMAGPGAWRGIAVAWSFIPLLNTLAFWRTELPALVHETHREKTRTMARTRTFWLCLLGILLAGAAEVALAQWVSAYAQIALGLPQVVANGVGLGLFGAMMIVGRLWFGLRGHNLELRSVLRGSALLSALCYFVVALAPGSWLPVIACGLAGLFVSMLWPGMVSLAAAAFPQAGISLFALLAAFGDSGAGAVPWLVGVIADFSLNPTMESALGIPVWLAGEPREALGLRLGLLFAGLFPLAMVLLLRALPPAAERKTSP